MTMGRFLIILLSFVFSVILGITLLYIFCEKNTTLNTSQNINTATHTSSRAISGPLVENGIILLVRCNEHEMRDEIYKNHICYKDTKSNTIRYLNENIGYKNIKGVFNDYINPNELKNAVKSLKSSKEIKRIIVVPIFWGFSDEYFEKLQNIKKEIIKKDKIILADLANNMHTPIFYNDTGFRLGYDKRESILTRIKECLDQAEKESPTQPCEPSGG